MSGEGMIKVDRNALIAYRDDAGRDLPTILGRQSDCLTDLGVHFGPQAAFQLPADRFNPGGYFQRKDIVDANRQLIEATSASIAEPAHPETILKARAADRSFDPDLAWASPTILCGTKDPRFSATLLTWIRSGLFGDRPVKIVRIKRGLQAIARSASQHKEVGSFCDYDMRKALAMATLYDRYAAWHCDHSGLPAHVVEYERLVDDPATSVAEMAAFIGIEDPALIQQATGRIGKRKAMVGHYAKKLVNPRLVAVAAKKTMKAWFNR